RNSTSRRSRHRRSSRTAATRRRHSSPRDSRFIATTLRRPYCSGPATRSPPGPIGALMHSAPTTDAELQHSLVVPNGAAQKPGRQYDLGEYALEDQVQHGLNLFLKLKSPAQFPALAAALGA